MEEKQTGRCVETQLHRRHLLPSGLYRRLRSYTGSADTPNIAFGVARGLGSPGTIPPVGNYTLPWRPGSIISPPRGSWKKGLHHQSLWDRML